MSDDRHDPTKWSHSSTELEARKTPPHDSSTADSIRSSQYSGTEEHANKTAISTSSEEMKALDSSGTSAQRSRSALKQTMKDRLTIPHPDDPDAKPVETSSADRSANLNAVISSGKRAKSKREATKSYKKAEGSELDIKQAAGLQGEGSKRDTFGNKPACS